jgi:hypothetical protein
LRFGSLVALLAATASAATPAPCGSAPGRAWKHETEPGVTVTCGPSKDGTPEECELLTVAPRGAKPWKIVQDNARQSAVHTARRGEVLLVATDRGVKLFTRKGRYNLDRKRQTSAVAQVLLELTPEERERMRSSGCTEEPLKLKVKPLDERRARLEVEQLDPAKKRLPPVELDLVLDEAVVTRATNPPPPAAPAPH